MTTPTKSGNLRIPFLSKGLLTNSSGIMLSNKMQWFLGTVLLFLCCLAIPANSLASTSKTSSGSTADTAPPPLSFQVGTGVTLEPQALPEYLHDYHTRAISLSSEAFQDAHLECIHDISYGPQHHNRLDVFWKKSSTPKKDLPVVVFLHGGGWDWGYKEWAGFVAQHICVQHDAILVTPSYKIGKGETQMWPESRNNVLQVLKWVETSIANYGGDPLNIILAGHSAGGHLASSVGLDTDLLQSYNVNPNSIRALFLISAPLGIRAQDFLPALWKFRLTRPLASLLYRAAVLKVLRPVVGPKGTDRVQAAADASPLATLEKHANTNNNFATTLPIVHYTYGAEGDFPICKPQLKRLETLMGKDRVQSLELPVTSHFETHFALADPTCEWYNALDKVLANDKNK